jgi:YesN/AraC family two-component response regulator
MRGHQVDYACSGRTALELFEKQPYDVALIDYSMPGMNGVELFRRMKEISPDVGGIFLTGYTTIDVVFPAIEAGVERVLSKPVDFEQLFPLLDEVSTRTV